MQKESMLALICLGFFAAVVLSIYFIMKYKAESAGKNFNTESVKKEPWDWQKPGIIVLGIGGGILIASLLENNNFYYNNDGINVGIVVVCTGISMIVANRQDKKNSSED